MHNKFYQHGRRDVLFGLMSMGITACFSQPDNKLRVKNNMSLQNLAATKGIIYGSHIGDLYEYFAKDKQFQSLFIQECALLVAGFQWEIIYPDANTFDFTHTDALAKFTADNNMLLRAQPLIYHSHQPQWLIEKFKNSNTTADEIKNIYVESIATIVGRYAGRVHSWIVVNEAINVDDGRVDGLRDTTKSDALNANGLGKYPTWLHFLGPDYIDLAFRTAAKADPHAMLAYNDWGLVYDTAEEEAKRKAVLELLKYLKSKNTPIHALGIQSHLGANRHQKALFNPAKFRQFLRDVANLGLKIIISELDAHDLNLPSNITFRDRAVAKAYSDVLSVALNEPAVIAVTTWGLSDRYTWLSWHSPRQDNLPLRPLPYDDKLKPKQARKALANSFTNAPKR